MLDFLRDLFGSRDDEDAFDDLAADAYSDGFQDGYEAGTDSYEDFLNGQERD